MDKRFIEESFPLREVSKEAINEKYKSSELSALHLWWARRPLTSSRTTNYAALIPASEDEIDFVKKRNLIIKLSKENNASDPNFIKIIKKQIIRDSENNPPIILDPFSGGGSIPLEALRIGCKTYATDYNPVAVLIEKCAMEYPQLYGKKLVDDLNKWGNLVYQEANKEIGKFFPKDQIKKGYFSESAEYLDQTSYIWTWTVKCQNQECNTIIPLLRQYLIAKRKNRLVSLYPIINGNKINFELVGDGYGILPNDFNPTKGTISRSTIKCPVCGDAIESKKTRNIFQQGKVGKRMIAVVTHKKGKSGKIYRISNELDYQIYLDAEKYLNKKIKHLSEEWGISPVPNEEIPFMSGTFNVPLYGISKWGDLFNSRQKLVLITLIEKIRNSRELMIEEGYDNDYSKIIITYLSLLVSRRADYSSILCVWQNTTEVLKHVFGRPALGMVWDHAEGNPFSNSGGSIKSILNSYIKSISSLSKISKNSVNVSQSNATNLSFEDNFFDAVFTDPPYYNSCTIC